MILVDTSAFIDFFKGARTEAAEKLDFVIKSAIPFGLNSLIYLELLQGVFSESEYKKLKTYLESQIFYDLKNGRESYATAAGIYRKCRSSGITVKSSIDILIVQTAIENKLMLLHNDKDYSFSFK